MTTRELANCDRRGSELTAYYNVGTCASPVWVQHIGIIGDLTIGETDDEEELSIRDPARYVKEYVEGKTDVAISGEQAVDNEYEGCAFFNSMRPGGTPGDVLVLNGTIDEEGVAGWRGKFWNFDRTVNGPNSGGATQAFNLKPAACQTSDCQVRPVRVATAGSIEDYEPGTFASASTTTSA